MRAVQAGGALRRHVERARHGAVQLARRQGAARAAAERGRRQALQWRAESWLANVRLTRRSWVVVGACTGRREAVVRVRAQEGGGRGAETRRHSPTPPSGATASACGCCGLTSSCVDARACSWGSGCRSASATVRRTGCRCESLARRDAHCMPLVCAHSLVGGAPALQARPAHSAPGTRHTLRHSLRPRPLSHSRPLLQHTDGQATH